MLQNQNMLFRTITNCPPLLFLVYYFNFAIVLKQNLNPETMTRTLTRAIPYLQVAIIATLFLTSFLVKPQFFNWLITSKQWGLEQVMISAVVFLTIYLPFVKSYTLIGYRWCLLIFTGWYMFVYFNPKGYQYFIPKV